MSHKHRVLEQHLAAPSKVDGVEAVIHGVKILGLESRNTGRVLGLDRRDFGEAVDKPYRYAAEAVMEAVRLYEGLCVNCDHLSVTTGERGERNIVGQRKVQERIGFLRNVTADDSGMHGDLCLLKSHPMTPLVMEMAERMPNHIAMSHHAAWLFEPVEGQAVATKCEEAESVDLIAERPGTTRNLFEAEHPHIERGNILSKTLKQVAESCKEHALGKYIARLAEDDMLGMDLPVDVPEEAPVEDSLKAAFKAAMMAVLDDDALDTAGKIGKLKEILKAHDKVSGKAEEVPAEEAEGDEEPAEGEEAKPEDEKAKPFESTAKELASLKRQIKVRDLCEAKSVKLDAVQLKAALALEETDLEAYLNGFITREVGKPRAPERRVTESYGGKELGEAKPDGKRLASLVKS